MRISEEFFRSQYKKILITILDIFFYKIGKKAILKYNIYEEI